MVNHITQNGKTGVGAILKYFVNNTKGTGGDFRY